MALTERMVDILKAIVDEFVSTAEPVGSKALVEKYNLPYSSATIRNDMAILEQLGYIEKPHTSAGRIPSNKGYQYYCENLLKEEIEDEVKYALSDVFSKKTMNIEDAIKESCKMISDMTSLTSGMLGPDSSLQTLQHLKVFPVDKKTAVCIFITNTGYTESKTFNFKDEVLVEDIEKCTEILNDRLKDTPINELSEKLESLRPILVNSIQRYEMLFNAFAGAFMKFASENVYFNGTGNMVYQPEYSDIEKLKEITRFFSDSKLFKQMIELKDENTLVAKTNRGTELMWNGDLAIVSSRVKINNEDNARLMVLGPRRMEYNKVIALLNYLTNEIEDIFN
jgi:heat-inducible transcriptional repressor